MPIQIDKYLKGCVYNKTTTIDVFAIKNTDELLELVRDFAFHKRLQGGVYILPSFNEFQKILQESVNKPLIVRKCRSLDDLIEQPTYLYKKENNLVKPLGIIKIQNIQLSNHLGNVYAGNYKIFNEDEVEFVYPEEEIKIGKCIRICRLKEKYGEINFNIQGSCEDAVKCLRAVKLMAQERVLRIGNQIISDDVRFPEDVLQIVNQKLEEVEKAWKVLRILHVSKKYNVATLKEMDMEKLLLLYQCLVSGEYIEKHDNTIQNTFIRYVAGPFQFKIVRLNKNGKIMLYDFFHCPFLHYGYKTMESSVFTLLKADDFLELDNIDYDAIVTDIARFAATYNESINTELLLQMLHAYDNRKNDIPLIKAAESISKILYDTYQNETSLLNYMQVKKRLSNVCEKDEVALMELYDKTMDNKEKCAIHLILGHKDLAKIQIKKMNEKNRKEFMENPIYNLTEY